MTLPDKPYSRDIKDAHPYLRNRWPRILEHYRKWTGKELFLTCTWRSPKEQSRLYAQGRTTEGPVVTWVDGFNKLSKHNLYPSHAIDVAVKEVVDQKVKVSWDYRDYLPLITICRVLDLESGGEWKKKDWPHIQIPRDLDEKSYFKTMG